MISKKMEAALNDQLNFELYSAYIYLSMSACLERMGLPGFSNWMRIQFQEEQMHADKIYHHILERGGKVTLGQIDAPQVDWPNVLNAFEDALGHEQKVTGRINNLMSLALDEKDHASAMFLQWFVTEQVEEEATADEIIQKLKLASESKAALFMMDKDMETRVFNAPAQGDA
ncbi:ferritin [Planctomycetota bacterium]